MKQYKNVISFLGIYYLFSLPLALLLLERYQVGRTGEGEKTVRRTESNLNSPPPHTHTRKQGLTDISSLHCKTRLPARSTAPHPHPHVPDRAGQAAARSCAER
jgi:hypothetical protein